MEQIEDIENIVINLDEYFGTIDVNIMNKENCTNLNIYLFRSGTLSSMQEVKNIYESKYSFKKLNPDEGPFFIVVGNDQYYGKSDNINLVNYSMSHAQISLTLDEKIDGNNLFCKLINTIDKTPIPIVTVQLKAITLDSFGIPKYIEKTTISNFEGGIIFEELPTLQGTLELKHSQYESISIPVHIDGKESIANMTIELSPHSL